MWGERKRAEGPAARVLRQRPSLLTEAELAHGPHQSQAKGKKAAGGKRLGGKDFGYYKLTVTDNGCGMKHDEIP